MRTLIFQVHGPMMSFGVTGGDKNRPTRVRPTRSAVLGLIMGAMGIERSDTETQKQVNEALSVSSLTRSEGRVDDDFHTVRAPRKGGHATRREEVGFMESRPEQHEGATIMTERSYVTDTYCRVGLSLDPEGDLSLEDVARSLTSPTFLPYAGRRSFPLGLPLNPQVFEELGMEAFRDYEVSQPAKLLMNGIDGRLLLSTRIPDAFDFEFRERSVRDDRAPGSRKFRKRTEWVTEVEEDVL